MSRLTDQTTLSALCLIHISGIFFEEKKCRCAMHQMSKLYIDNISETHDVVNTSS